MVAGPGSQALIHALSRIAPRGAVGVLGPTYGGHAAAFAAAGASVVEAARLEDMGDLNVAIVVNPNNPDGRITRRADLLELHERLARRGGMLIVDEAFADFDGAERKPRAGAARERRGRAALLRQVLRTGRASPWFCDRLAGHRPALAGGAWALAGQRSGDRDRDQGARRSRLGRTQCARASARTRSGSTLCSRETAGASSAERGSSASPRAMTQARLSAPAHGRRSHATLRGRARSAAIWHPRQRGEWGRLAAALAG